MMNHAHALAAGVLAAGCAACSGSSASSDASTDARIALSYGLSTSIWLDAWLNGASPRAYTKRSLESVEENMGKLLLQKRPPANEIAALRRDIDEARVAVEADDRSRVKLAQAHLHNSTAALDAWARAHPE